MTLQAHVVGWGKYVPSRVLSNHDLELMVDTTDEWIVARTGIHERRIASEKETTASLSINASLKALEVARMNPTQVELIIVATVTPDYFLPSTACLVQDGLGATRAAAFDLSAGCSGFVYGLSVAAHMLRAGAYRTALVIGAETLTRITNWEDRGTCVLFGDGAGAIVLQAREEEGGVLSTVLGADGSGGELLQVPAGGSKAPPTHRTVSDGLHYIHMKGREVFRFAVRIVPSATRQVLEQAGLTPKDVDLLIPHQANQRIIDAATRSLGIREGGVYSNVSSFGNTSAASIPIALSEAAEKGLINPGNLIVCVGFGAGLTWAAAAIRWLVPQPEPLPVWSRLFRSLMFRLVTIRSWVLRVLRRLGALLVRNGFDSGDKKKE
jgi:3-oxoacyl-[acyl-carrier-protein] synthase-3